MKLHCWISNPTYPHSISQAKCARDGSKMSEKAFLIILLITGSSNSLTDDRIAFSYYRRSDKPVNQNHFKLKSATDLQVDSYAIQILAFPQIPQSTLSRQSTNSNTKFEKHDRRSNVVTKKCEIDNYHCVIELYH